MNKDNYLSFEESLKMTNNRKTLQQTIINTYKNVIKPDRKSPTTEDYGGQFNSILIEKHDSQRFLSNRATPHSQ